MRSETSTVLYQDGDAHLIQWTEVDRSQNLIFHFTENKWNLLKKKYLKNQWNLTEDQ